MPDEECPISKEKLNALFTHLEKHHAGKTCSGKLLLTQQWLREQGLPVGPMLNWCQNHGGFCDCEVLYNIAFAEEN